MLDSLLKNNFGFVSWNNYENAASEIANDILEKYRGEFIIVQGSYKSAILSLNKIIDITIEDAIEYGIDDGIDSKKPSDNVVYFQFDAKYRNRLIVPNENDFLDSLINTLKDLGRFDLLLKLST
jgi:hypothetical protein